MGPTWIRTRFSALALLIPLLVGAGGDDDLADYRERFKAGYEKYKAGQVAEALQYWEPIYRELGVARGYRIAYNLARAYDQYGDFTRAAERYESFIGEVDARRAKKEKIDPLVEKEDKEARMRLLELVDKKGRIKINAGERPVAVKIDAAEPRVSGFVAYVNPGAHVVTLGDEKRDVTVKAGELVEVTPSANATPGPTPIEPPPVTSPAPPPQETETRVERPFSPVVLYVAAGVTVVSVVFPVVTYASAVSYQGDNKLTNDPAHDDPIRKEYDSKSRAFYLTLAIPITLAAVTTGLTAAYFLGSKQVVVPVASPTRGGAYLGVRAAF